MPFWTIYHSHTAFSKAEDRDAFADAITKSYHNLPPFYIVICFIPLTDGHLYRSGARVHELESPFVRLVVHHLARHAGDCKPEEDGHARMKAVVDHAIADHIVAKNYLWEYTISEDDRRLWKIDGQVPPPFDSEIFEEWKRNDKASPYALSSSTRSGA